MGKELRAITAVTRRRQVLSIAGAAEDMERGPALGVFEDSDKVKLMVNTAAAKQEGVSFADALLSSAALVGD